jgi:hypothetical protein
MKTQKKAAAADARDLLDAAGMHEAVAKADSAQVDTQADKIG